MPHSVKPEISVIIPVLNEAANLPAQVENLARQRDVRLEIVISDGGSSDGTFDLALRLAQESPFPATVLQGEPGRGRQLNRGAERSLGSYLMFMHADCTLPDPTALRRAIDTLAPAGGEKGMAAGKFRLSFSRNNDTNPFGYYFYESKARLLRRECTHGDQGLLMHRLLFQKVGPFEESLPMLAETRLADRIHEVGRWLLLPAEISTSARRFETEGLRERQTLNAIIMNFAALGWDRFFRELPEIYRHHDQAGRLPLEKILRETDRLIASLPPRERLALWSRTGSYVRSNSWQPAFARDVFRNFRNGLPPGEGPTPLLELHDRHFDRLTDHAAGKAATALLVWLWFRISCT